MKTKKTLQLLLVCLCTIILSSCNNNEIDRGKLSEALLKYETFSAFSDGFSVVMSGNKYGLIDLSGKEVVPCKYDWIGGVDEWTTESLFQDGVALIQSDGKWGLINKTGKEIVPCTYKDYYGLTRGGSGIFIISENGKYGCIDKNGKRIVDCNYDRIEPFYEGIGIAKLSDKYVLINENGKVIPLSEFYTGVLHFSEGLAAVQMYGSGIEMYNDDARWGFIDKTGEEVIPCNHQLNYDDNIGYQCFFADGMAAVINEDYKWGFLNKEGKEVVPFKYLYVEDFSEGLAAVAISAEGEMRWGFIDKAGREVIPCKYEELSPFSDNVAAACKNGKYGFIDKDGKQIIPFDYNKPLGSDDVKTNAYFKDGLAILAINNGGNSTHFNIGEGKQGVLSKYDKTIIPFIYDDINLDSKNEFFVCRIGDYTGTETPKYGIFDKTGKEIAPVIFEELNFFNDGFAKAKWNGKDGFIDMDGYFIGKGVVEKIVAIEESKTKEKKVEVASNNEADMTMSKRANKYTKDALLDQKIDDIIHFFTHNGLQAKYTYRDAEMMDVLDISTGQFVSSGQTFYDGGNELIDGNVVLRGKCRGYGKPKGSIDFKQVTSDFDTELTISVRALRGDEWIMPRGFPLAGDVKFKINYNPYARFEIIYDITEEIGSVPMTVYKKNNTSTNAGDMDWLIGTWEVTIPINGRNMSMQLVFLDDCNILIDGERGIYTIDNEYNTISYKTNKDANIRGFGGTSVPFNKERQELKAGDGYYFRKISSNTSSSSNNSFQPQTTSDGYIVKERQNSGVEAYLFYRYSDGDYVSASILWDDIQGNYLTIYNNSSIATSIRYINGDYSLNYLGPTTASNGVKMMNYSFGKSIGKFSLSNEESVIITYTDKMAERFDFRR